MLTGQINYHLTPSLYFQVSVSGKVSFIRAIQVTFADESDFYLNVAYSVHTSLGALVCTFVHRSPAPSDWCGGSGRLSLNTRGPVLSPTTLPLDSESPHSLGMY